MKVNRTYSLSVRNVERLSNANLNASELIDNLLTEYFEHNVDGVENIKAKIAELEARQKNDKSVVSSLQKKLKIAEHKARNIDVSDGVEFYEE